METTSWGRLIGALVGPRKTFESIVARPTWVLALAVLVALPAVTGLLSFQKMDMGEMVRESAARQGRELSEEEIDQALEVAERFGAVGALAAALVFLPLGYLCLALVLWVVFKLLGGEFGYRTSVAVGLHALMPWALAYLLSIPVILGRSGIGYEEAQSGILVSNLAFLAPEDASLALRALLGSFDLFSLWTVGLLVLGYSLAARVSRSTATITVGVCWLVYIAGKVGWTALWS